MPTTSAPSLLGGVVLLRGYEPLDVVRLPVPERFCCTVAHRGIVVSTREARAVLPHEIPLRSAVSQWVIVGGLVAGLMSGDVELVGRSMRDVVAEPHRKRFIPGFDELRDAVIAAGALAMKHIGCRALPVFVPLVGYGDGGTCGRGDEEPLCRGGESRRTYMFRRCRTAEPVC